MKPIIITSSDLRPGCRDLSILMRLDESVKQPTNLPMRMGLLRHEVRRECFKRNLWPPVAEAMAATCRDVWVRDFSDLSVEEFGAVRDQMLNAVKVNDLWPPRDSILAVEDWMPSVPKANIVEHRGEPGWDVLIGTLSDGTEVHLRSRFDLVFIAEDDVSRGELLDTKGAGGDYEYQAKHNALGASILWDGIPKWRYRAAYLAGGRRPQEFEFDAAALAKIRKELMAEGARIHAELLAKAAEPTPCDSCDWCPKATTCPALQRALTPLATMPQAFWWPAAGELKTLPDQELLNVYQRFQEPCAAVGKYDKALDSAIKARLRETKAPLLGPDGTGVRLSTESGGQDCIDMLALITLLQKHGLKLDDCLNPAWGEISKGLNKYTDEPLRQAAIAEFDALKVPKKPVEKLRPAKLKEAA